MGEQTGEHVSERFARLLDLYRKPDGWEWGGQDLERATGGVATRSYVASLKKGRIEHPGVDKLGALASAMGFPPGLWFGDEGGPTDGALAAALGDPTTRAIVVEAARAGPGAPARGGARDLLDGRLAPGGRRGRNGLSGSRRTNAGVMPANQSGDDGDADTSITLDTYSHVIPGMGGAAAAPRRRR